MMPLDCKLNTLSVKDLAAMFATAGCSPVLTYIQSGNVVFRASQATAARVPAGVAKAVSDRRGFRAPVVLRTAAELRAEAKTVVFFAAGNAATGFAAVADPIKDGSAEAVAALRRDGIRVIMLTGDAKPTAEAVARALGIEEFRAQVLPEDKAGHVKRL